MNKEKKAQMARMPPAVVGCLQALMLPVPA